MSINFASKIEKNYLRNGTTENSNQLAMDEMSYFYESGTNQLRIVLDEVAASNYAVDIDDQADPLNSEPAEDQINYLYDASGNLIKDKAEGINIKWNVAGKVIKIEKSDDTVIDFYYDAMGNRIGKKVTDAQQHATTTWYVLDPQGNQMAVYTQTTEALSLDELVLYGSSRLGVLRTKKLIYPEPEEESTIAFAYGRKRYELSNHLGNVLTTVSDFTLPTWNGIVPSPLAFVLTQQDYYPFGAPMPERSYAFSVNVPVFEPGEDCASCEALKQIIETYLTTNENVDDPGLKTAIQNSFPELDFSSTTVISLCSLAIDLILYEVNWQEGADQNAYLCPAGIYEPTVVTYSDDYRYGFNGQERTDEVYGKGNLNTALFWEYDTRLGRRWNIVLLTKLI